MKTDDPMPEGVVSGPCCPGTPPDPNGPSGSPCCVPEISVNPLRWMDGLRPFLGFYLFSK